MAAKLRIVLATFLICAHAAALPPGASAETYGYDFNHDAAPGHQQTLFEYVDKYVYFDEAVPGSFGWRRSGITSNIHGGVAANGPPGLYELYYDSNNSWDAATFSTNLGNGSHLVTLYWGRSVPGGANAFSFSVTFEDTVTVILTCSEQVACDYSRPVDVADGTLDITFDHVNDDWWMISGIWIDLQPTTAVDPIRPGESALRGSSPNPFRSRTEIEFDLRAPGRVRLDVFTVTGARVATLVDGRRDAGLHRVTWGGRGLDGALLPGGLYFLRLETEGHREIGKTVLLR